MTGERRHRVELVDELLAELAEARRRLYRLRAGGALPAGLRDAEEELELVRRRLAEAV
ncbi:MAG TPA: hypothetical protein VFL60_05655 [Gaiellaceae bacterium]|nr:hypothetical protein [Gaiellaceae bacterium]